MANWCSIKMVISCKDDTVTNNIRQILEMMYAIAEEQKIGMYLGTKDRYIFDTAIYTQNQVLTLEGVTRWYVDPNDFKSWIEFLISQGDDILSATLYYEELGCQVYGIYSYNGNNYEIHDKYIPVDMLPPYRESYSEVYYDILDAYLEDNGVEKFIGKVNNKELTLKRQQLKELSFAERQKELTQIILDNSI